MHHIADLLDVSRTQLLIDTFRAEISDLSDDDAFQRRLRDAYYSEAGDFDIVESILGTEKAMRMKFIRDSINHDPPEPQLEGNLPTANSTRAMDDRSGHLMTPTT